MKYCHTMWSILWLELVQLHGKFPIPKLTCLYLLCFPLPLLSDFEFWVEFCMLRVSVSATIWMLLHPCFSLMDRHTLIQHFHHIISLASLAYTFIVLHTIQYLMRNHDNDNGTHLDHHHMTRLNNTNITHRQRWWMTMIGWVGAMAGGESWWWWATLSCSPHFCAHDHPLPSFAHLAR